MKWPEVSPKRLLTALCVCGWILIIIVIIVVIVIFVIRDEPRPTDKFLLVIRGQTDLYGHSNRLDFVALYSNQSTTAPKAKVTTFPLEAGIFGEGVAGLALRDADDYYGGGGGGGQGGQYGSNQQQNQNGYGQNQYNEGWSKSQQQQNDLVSWTPASAAGSTPSYYNNKNGGAGYNKFNDYSSYNYYYYFGDRFAPFTCINVQERMRCWQYFRDSGSWTETLNLRNVWYGAPTTYDESIGLVMSAVRRNFEGLRATFMIYTRDGRSFKQLSELPGNKQGHCMTVVTNGNLFLAGGDRFSKRETFILNRNNNRWITAPRLPTGRMHPICGSLKDRSEVVVAGGRNVDMGPVDNVEIFNLSQESWKIVKRLPQPIERATAVPFGLEFLLVGGFTGSGLYSSEHLRTIYRYDAASDTWVEMPYYLTEGMANPVAVVVERRMFENARRNSYR